MKFFQFQSPSRSLEPPNLNLPSQGDFKTFEESALPSIKQDHSNSHMKAAAGEENHDVGAHDDGHKVDHYPVTTVDFARVETPFIIGVWILFASIAKIGECTQRLC